MRKSPGFNGAVVTLVDSSEAELDSAQGFVRVSRESMAQHCERHDLSCWRTMDDVSG
jgi:hypothetical protein